MFEHSLTIPEDALDPWLETIPSSPVVFAIFGHDAASGPYIAKTANLRRRLRRLLTPATADSHRAGSRSLYLGGRAARLEYSQVGSQFATSLLLLAANRKFYDVRARKRLHLRPPVLLRLTSENQYPRMYVTNRVTQSALNSTYGPFASRSAAERYLDDSLNFFLLRRCTDTLHPDPAFPGCVYSEMKMCLAPCFRGCTDARYAEEAERVREYFASRGGATIARIEQEREAASAELNFEAAAQLHQRAEKMKAVAQQAAPVVHPIAELDAVLVQPAARGTDRVAIFLVHAGRILGPGFYSVEGMRHPNENAGSTSLFAHPTLLEPTLLDAPPVEVAAGPAKPTRGFLEERLQAVLKDLEAQAHGSKLPADQLGEHLSLLARWYYRSPQRRTGEIFFRDDARAFPLSRILRGISRVFCGQEKIVEDVEKTSSPVEPRGV